MNILPVSASKVRPMALTRRMLLVVAFLFAVSVDALAVDARERGFISAGMAEGEVIFKIGPPDHEAFIQNVRGEAEEKTWTYFPTARDAQTLIATPRTFANGVSRCACKRPTRTPC